MTQETQMRKTQTEKKIRKWIDSKKRFFYTEIRPWKQWESGEWQETAVLHKIEKAKEKKR